MRNLRLREHRKLAQVTKTLGLGLNPPGVCSLFCGPFVWETEEGLGAPRATPTLPSSRTPPEYRQVGAPLLCPLALP